MITNQELSDRVQIILDQEAARAGDERPGAEIPEVAAREMLERILQLFEEEFEITSLDF